MGIPSRATVALSAVKASTMNAAPTIGQIICNQCVAINIYSNPSKSASAALSSVVSTVPI